MKQHSSAQPRKPKFHAKSESVVRFNPGGVFYFEIGKSNSGVYFGNLLEAHRTLHGPTAHFTRKLVKLHKLPSQNKSKLKPVCRFGISVGFYAANRHLYCTLLTPNPSRVQPCGVYYRIPITYQ